MQLLLPKDQSTDDLALRIQKSPTSPFSASWTMPLRGAPEQYLPLPERLRADSPVLIPVPKDEPWETVPALAGRFGVTLVAGIFPPLSQMHERFYGAVRRAGMPCVSFLSSQREAAAVAARTLHIRGVVALERDIPAIHSAFSARNGEVRYYQSLTDFNEKPSPALPAHTYREVHLVPGIVALFQCDTLAEHGAAFFHPSERFAWDWDESGVRMTDMQGRFMRMRVPALVARETCSCERVVMQRT